MDTMYHSYHMLGTSETKPHKMQNEYQIIIKLYKTSRRNLILNYIKHRAADVPHYVT